MNDERKTELSKKLIFEALKKYRDLFDFPPSDEALSTYSEMLVNQFEFKQVTWALTEHVKKGAKKFPSCGEIFSYLAPAKESTEDKAATVAEEIIQYAQAYGYMQTEKAFAAMSDDARIACGSPSYLLHVCNTPLDDLTTLRAQIRKHAKSAFERTINNSKNEKLESIGIVLEMKRPEFYKLDYSQFLPENPA